MGANIRLYEVTYKGGGVSNFCEKVFAVVPKESRKTAIEFEKKFGANSKIADLKREAKKQFQNLKKGGKMSKEKLRKAKKRLKQRVKRAIMKAEEEAKAKGYDLNEIAHLFEIWGLKPGYEYNFQVRARNHVGWSAWSPASISASTKADCPEMPEPPSLKRSWVVQNNGLIQMKWLIPFHRGAMITRYSITCIETGEEHEMDADIYDTTFGTSGLPDGVDEEGGEEIVDEDDEVAPVVGRGGIISPPRSPKVKKEKKIDKKPKATPTLLAERIAAVKLQVRGSGAFVPGEFYTFTVKAKNLIGWSATSHPSRKIKAPCLVPDEPAAPSCSDFMPRSLKVRWRKPNGNGSEPTHYELYMCIAQTGVFTPIVIGDKEKKETKLRGEDVQFAGFSGIFQYHVRNLKAGQCYEFKVAAFNEVGKSSISPSSMPSYTQAPMEPMALEPPTLDPIFTKPTSCVLKWKKPDDDGGAAIIKYHLYIHRGKSIDDKDDHEGDDRAVLETSRSNLKEKDSDSSSDDDWREGLRLGDDWDWQKCLTTNSHGRGGNVENLAPHVEYHFAVIAENKCGKSQRSAPSEVVVLPNKMEFILKKRPGEK
eukprot:g2316.t1